MRTGVKDVEVIEDLVLLARSLIVHGVRATDGEHSMSDERRRVLPFDRPCVSASANDLLASNRVFARLFLAPPYVAAAAAAAGRALARLIDHAS